MNVALVSAALFASFALSAQAVLAADHAPTGYFIPAAKQPGNFEAATASEWSSALVLSRFTDSTTHMKASEDTSVSLEHDASSLFVGFVNRQREPIIATQRTNDVGAGIDDADTVSIDTSGNGTRVYTFSVTPNGVRYETSTESSRYAPTWRASASRANGMWKSMLAIPFNALRAERRNTQAWRMNFTRHIAYTQQDFSWAFDPAAQTMADARYWPLVTLVLTVRPRPAPHADFFVLTSSGGDRREFESATGSFEAQQPRLLGGDFTYPFTNTLAFVGTIAPDFSNLENDQTTISPQEFRRAYTEYRPFFAQGAKYIDPLPQGITVTNTPDTTFYSPGIGTFDHGYKVEGIAGLASLGALAIDGPGFHDQALGFQVDNSAHAFSFFSQATLAHHVDGVDGTIGLGMRAQNQASGTSAFVTYNSERGTFVAQPAQANRLSFGGGVATSRIVAYGMYKDVGPDYAPVDGYTSLNDARGPVLLLQLNEAGSSHSRVKTWSILSYADRFTDRSGAVHETTALESGTVTLKNLLSLTLTADNGSLRYYDQPYPVYQGPHDVRFDTNQIVLGYRDGTASPIDLTYSEGPFGVPCLGQPGHAAFCAAAPPGLIQAFLQQFDFTLAHPLGTRTTASAEYSATRERAFGIGDGQRLRKIAITRSLGAMASISVALRNIDGAGGYGIAGTNLAISFHQHFAQGHDLWLEYGTPAEYRTLNRLLVKYVFHVGGGSGT